MGLLNADVVDGLLDAAARNQRVIGNNLANLNTPGYRTARLRFRRRLESALRDADDGSAPAELFTEIYRPGFADAGPDGNDVSLEREIVELNKNTTRARLYLALLGFRIRQMQTAIEGR